MDNGIGRALCFGPYVCDTTGKQEYFQIIYISFMALHIMFSMSELVGNTSVKQSAFANMLVCCSLRS